MRIGVVHTLTPLTTTILVSTLTRGRISLTKKTSLLGLPGKILGVYRRKRPDFKQTNTPRDRPGFKTPLNDNQCIVPQSQGSGQETGQWTNFSNRTRIRTDCKWYSKTDRLCKFKCCFSCTYCNRAATKERRKSSHCKSKQSSVIKACEQCFLCRSIVFCNLCAKCPTCCSKSSCRGQAGPILAGLGRFRSWSQSPPNVERGLHPTFPNKTKFDQVSNSCKLLCTSPQEPRPVGGIASAYKEKCSRTSPKSGISGVLQQTIFSPKTKQKMETYTGPKLSQSIPQGRKIQNGNPGNNKNLTTSRRVGYVHRFQGRLLPHTHSQSVQEILEVSCPEPNLPVQSPTLRSINSPLRVHCRNQGGQAHGTTAGYKDPPVPRRLVGPGQLVPALPPQHQSTSGFMSKIGLDNKYGKVRAGTQTGVRFCRLPVRSYRGKGQTHLGQVANLDKQNHRITIRSDLSGPKAYVPYWSVNSYRKTGPPRPPTHAAHLVASQEQLEGSRVNGKSHSNPQIPPPSSKMVAGGKQCAQRSTITSTKTCSSVIYRHLKRRLGRSLKRAHCKRGLVTSRKQVAHKFFGAKGSIFSPEKVPKSLSKQCCPDSHRQHYSGGIHKQGRRHEIRTSMCPPLEDYDLVYQKSGHPQS